MKAEEPIVVSRPDRWLKPMDASMSDAEIAWLRSREPFASMNPRSCPRTMPLEGILRNDCRIRRCEPGEFIVRRGDYGCSAFLVLAGSVRVVVDALGAEQMGRPPQRRWSWLESLQRSLFPSPHPETRQPDEIASDPVPPAAAATSPQVRWVDDRPAIFLQDFEGVLRENETVTLGPGEVFGEVAAMYRAARSATVIAETEATLLEIRWQGLRLLRSDLRFAESLDAHYRKHWLPVHLREIPLLKLLPESSLARVVAATQLRSFGRNEWYAHPTSKGQLPVGEQIEAEPIVANEGRVPTDLIVIRSGFARLSRQVGASHCTTSYLGKGRLFGLNELAYNALRSSELPPRSLQDSLRAVGFLETLFIPAEVFAEEILPHARRSELPRSAAELLFKSKDQRQGNRRLKDERDRGGTWRNKGESASQRQATSPAPMEPDLPTAELLEFIVDHRMNNGRQAMVIDLHRCTRCDDCVNACASAHDGNARFVREGVTHGRLQFVHACMHCSDPVCMIGCPTGAIARDETSGVVEIHESICVGCGTCASNCPYENIRMAQVFDSEGRPYRSAQSDQPMVKATKCDLCSRQPAGPVCARACPHDALVRIDLTESQPLQHWLERRS